MCINPMNSDFVIQYLYMSVINHEIGLIYFSASLNHTLLRMYEYTKIFEMTPLRAALLQRTALEKDFKVAQIDENEFYE